MWVFTSLCFCVANKTCLTGLLLLTASGISTFVVLVVAAGLSCGLTTACLVGSVSGVDVGVGVAATANFCFGTFFSAGESTCLTTSTVLFSLAIGALLVSKTSTFTSTATSDLMLISVTSSATTCSSVDFSATEFVSFGKFLPSSTSDFSAFESLSCCFVGCALPDCSTGSCAFSAVLTCLSICLFNSEEKG